MPAPWPAPAGFVILLAGVHGQDAPRRPDAEVSQVAGQDTVATFRQDGTLEELVATAATSLGTPVIWSADVPDAKRRIALGEERSLPAAQVAAFLETALARHGLALVRLGPPGAEFRVIESEESAPILRVSRFVPREDLAGYQNRHVPISTLVMLKNLPADLLWRRLWRRGVGSSLVSIPSSNSLLLTDLGPVVSRMAELIEQMDGRGRRPHRCAAELTVKPAAVSARGGMVTLDLDAGLLFPHRAGIVLVSLRRPQTGPRGLEASFPGTSGTLDAWTPVSATMLDAHGRTSHQAVFRDLGPAAIGVLVRLAFGTVDGCCVTTTAGSLLING